MKKLCWDLLKADLRIQLPWRRGSLCAAWAQAEGEPFGLGALPLCRQEGVQDLSGGLRKTSERAAYHAD